MPTHSDAEKARALVQFRELGTVKAACEAAGIGRRTWYDWLEADPEFASLVMAANEDVTDELEAEAIKRAKAKDGSDTLLTFLLRARRPQLYREKQVIEVVSPDVQDRLQRQADAIMAICPPETAQQLAAALREIWT